MKHVYDYRKVEARIRSLGFKYQEVARLMNEAGFKKVGSAHVQRWATGTEPRASYLLGLAKVLKCNPGEFVS